MFALNLLLFAVFCCAFGAAFDLGVNVRVRFGGAQNGHRQAGPKPIGVGGGQQGGGESNSSSTNNCSGYNGSTIVQTENGLVNGTTGSYFSNVTVWKGIPFAAPPVSALRWREPLPAQNWSGVLAAQSFGAPCYSQNNRNSSEDCLYLNIYSAPDNSSSCNPLRPVYFWIYGGGYVAGAASDSTFDGEGLAAKGILVVTINYRLGVFGFLSLPELSAESGRNASGNYGLMDQIFALKWVQRNIAAFGGDPQKVTIGGHSAGAGSVYMLMLSPLAKGLFRAAKPESGGVFQPQDPEIASLPSSHYNMSAAEQSGLDYLANYAGNSNYSLAELRNLSADVLGVKSGYGLDDSMDPETCFNGKAPYFHPVTDGYVFPRNYEQTLTMGAQNDVPVMTGNNHDEWGAWGNVTAADYNTTVYAKYGDMSAEFLAFYPGSNDTEASANKNNAIRDNSRTSTFLWSQLWLKSARSPLFYYWYTYVGSMDSSGACHGCEIPFFFDNLYNQNGNLTAQDYAVADTMSNYVVNFVTNMDPSVGRSVPKWPAANGVDQVVMEVGNGYVPIPILDSAAKLNFLKRFYATQRQW